MDNDGQLRPLVLVRDAISISGARIWCGANALVKIIFIYDIIVNYWVVVGLVGNTANPKVWSLLLFV